MADIKTIAKRPIDCESKLINRFINIVAKGGEVPRANLLRGVPAAERLFFTVTGDGDIAGVGAIRFQNANYHRHLFEQAGAPHMYNPDSSEFCWVYVKPEFRGQGAGQSNLSARFEYIGNRPCHCIRRIDNKLVHDDRDWVQAGVNFNSATSTDDLKLLVRNHDEIYDENKGLIYGPRPSLTSV